MRLRSEMSRSTTVSSVFSPTCSFEIEASAGNSSPFWRRPSIPGQPFSHAASDHISVRNFLDVLTMSPAKPFRDQTLERSPDHVRLRITIRSAPLHY